MTVVSRRKSGGQRGQHLAHERKTGSLQPRLGCRRPRRSSRWSGPTLRQFDTRQIGGVFPIGSEPLTLLGTPRAQRDAPSGPRQRDAQRGAPGAGAQDCDARINHGRFSSIARPAPRRYAPTSNPSAGQGNSSGPPHWAVQSRGRSGNWPPAPRRGAQPSRGAGRWAGTGRRRPRNRNGLGLDSAQPQPRPRRHRFGQVISFQHRNQVRANSPVTPDHRNSDHTRAKASLRSEKW